MEDGAARATASSAAAAQQASSAAAAQQWLGPDDEVGRAAAVYFPAAARRGGWCEDEVGHTQVSQQEFQVLCDSQWKMTTEEQEAVNRESSGKEFQTLCDAEWRKAIENQWAAAWAALDGAAGAKAVLQTPKQDHHHSSTRSLKSWPDPYPCVTTGTDEAPRSKDAHAGHAGSADRSMNTSTPVERILSNAWSTKALPAPRDRDQLLRQLFGLLESAAGPGRGAGSSQEPGQLPRALAEPATRRELVQGIQQLQAKVAECSEAIDILWKAAQAVTVDEKVDHAESVRPQGEAETPQGSRGADAAAVMLEPAFFDTMKRAFFNSTDSPNSEA